MDWQELAYFKYYWGLTVSMWVQLIQQKFYHQYFLVCKKTILKYLSHNFPHFYYVHRNHLSFFFINIVYVRRQMKNNNNKQL